MNASVETVTLKIGDGILIVPAEGLARIWIDQQLKPQAQNAPIEALVATVLNASPIPIGAEVSGQIYAGLTLHDNAPHRLFLMPGEFEGPWKDAMAWAAKQGGGDCVLPSRIDALVLFQNLKREFKEEWHWTSEPYAHYADYAWIHFFLNGYQNFYPTSYHYRARAVRRVAI